MGKICPPPKNKIGFRSEIASTVHRLYHPQEGRQAYLVVTVQGSLAVAVSDYW